MQHGEHKTNLLLCVTRPSECLLSDPLVIKLSNFRASTLYLLRGVWGVEKAIDFCAQRKLLPARFPFADLATLVVLQPSLSLLVLCGQR